ncbi:MAG: cyclic nucleotide-binding domain-containing protein [Nitrosomonadales bacterium]|nr:cyclic nucleotide-binding domain-containing protein [Nitrosomonadales bacterium]
MSEVADYKIVRNSTLGADLTEENARILAEKMGVRYLRDGDILVKEGASDQTLFILAKGRVDFFCKDESGAEQPASMMREGECAGTRAFVEQKPRRGTLRAVGEATVYTLTPADFETVLDNHPRIAFMVMRALFRETHANLSRKNRETEEMAKYIHKTQGRF